MTYELRRITARLLSILSLAFFFLVTLGFIQIALAADSVTEDATQSINIQNWQLILGFVLPLVTAIILQQAWSSSLKAVVAFVFMLLVTTIGMFISGDLNSTGDLLGAILAVFATSITSYLGFWKPTGIAPGIERATSV